MTPPAPPSPQRPDPQTTAEAVRGGFRRLVGIDRSGPLPASTRRGQPLRPWTIPNAVGYLRLASIPAFLVLAFDSGDGRSAGAALLYLWITLGDFIDGFLARATGQYSRLGALMDPVIDRLSALAGAVVCWHFELLPRWALLVLVARELVTVALARGALRRGLDLEISWVGRLGTFGVFSGLFWTLVIDSWLTVALFFVGLALGIYATTLYALAGRRALRELRFKASTST
jgi:cardiolipin synthase (CMP-forming)